MRNHNKGRRIAGAVAILAIIMAATYAFTAANTVPGSKAGDGSGAVTGYTVSTIHYNLNAANPGNIDSVTFTLDSAPVAGSVVKAQLAAAGTWYNCSTVTTAATCTTTGASVVSATDLRVVIAQ